VGNLRYGSQELWNIAGTWRAANMINFILNFYLYLPKENKDRKP